MTPSSVWCRTKAARVWQLAASRVHAGSQAACLFCPRARASCVDLRVLASRLFSITLHCKQLLTCNPTSRPQASRLEAPTFRLVCGVLLALAASEDGAGLLLRGPFLASCHKALQDMANSNASGSAGGGGPGAGGPARLGRDLQRQAVLLQVSW